ncbi:MAG: hypothetical protein ACLGHY_07265 [Gammaproteobacteria bacterium]
MSINHALSFAAVLAVSAAAQAQDCARGPQGGMDMNGDECSTSVTQIEHELDPAIWAAISASMHRARQATPDPGARASASLAPVAHPLASDRSPDGAPGTTAVIDLSDY